MTKEERDAAVAANIEDPEPLFASIRDELRRTTKMTEEQIEWSEGYARFVLGYPKPEPTPSTPEHSEAKSVLDAKLAEGRRRHLTVDVDDALRIKKGRAGE